MNLQARYFTTGQAAAELNVNRLTVLRWVAAGRLTGQRVGNVTLIDRAQVEHIAQERMSESPATAEVEQDDADRA